MKTLRQLHLYLGCVFAPVLIFFAISGAWQMFDLHQGRKDGSYVPPKILVTLSDVHQHQQLERRSPGGAVPLRYFVLIAVLGLVLTTILGIVMAFRFSRSKGVVLLCLLVGIFLPAILLFLKRS